MRSWDVKTKIIFFLALALIVFLTYLFFRVRMASGLPVVHTVWSGELSSLLRTIARSVQLLGILAGATSLVAAVKRWRAKQPLVFVQLLQAAVLCSISFLTPDLVAQCLPVLFGSMLNL